MHDFKLKIILSILGGIVLSFIFILLAFVLPAKDKNQSYTAKPGNLLEEVSHSMR